MISKLRFRNFKSLVDLELPLTRFTVLVGANGSGKSSILQAAHLLSQVGVPGSNDFRTASVRFGEIFQRSHEPRRLRTSSVRQPVMLGMTDDDGDALSLEIRIPETGAEESPQASWPAYALAVAGLDGADRLEASTRGSGEPPPTQADMLAAMKTLNDSRVRKFASAVYLHLDAAVMTRTSVVDEEVPRMGANGEGLASALAWLAGAAPELLGQIAADLAKVVPGVRRIRIFRSQVRDQTMEQVDIDGQSVWRPVTRSRVGDRFAIEFEHTGNVPADLLSEGTVLALGLITKLYEPMRPRLVMLDDIDRALHPAAQVRLVETLRALLDSQPDLQLLCTTHSPYLLSAFRPEEVTVLALDQARRTHARPLTAHPDFPKLQFGFQTGEIWTALGEDWVTGGAAGG